MYICIYDIIYYSTIEHRVRAEDVALLPPLVVVIIIMLISSYTINIVVIHNSISIS